MRRHEAVPHELKRQMQRAVLRKSADRDAAFERVIRSIPAGRVSTYGRVAAAAGYPMFHRAVARFLRTEVAGILPWHRVVGAGGEIKLRWDAGEEQRLRLRTEGVPFRGERVDMDAAEHVILVESLD